MTKKRMRHLLMLLIVFCLAVTGFAGCASEGEQDTEFGSEDPPIEEENESTSDTAENEESNETEETSPLPYEESVGNEDGENEADDEQSEETPSYTVEIRDFAFQPEQLTVEAGSEITFTNLDDAEHTATDTNDAFDSGLLAQGESYTVTLSEPGEYEIYCQPHPNMTGTIIVE